MATTITYSHVRVTTSAPCKPETDWRALLEPSRSGRNDSQRLRAFRAVPRFPRSGLFACIANIEESPVVLSFAGWLDFLEMLHDLIEVGHVGKFRETVDPDLLT